MFSKIYLALLGVSITVMAFFTYYSWSWLQSIGQPAAAEAGFEYHSSLGLGALWLLTTVLAVAGTGLLWVNRSAWAIWATFLYFTTFVVIRYIWIDRIFLNFVQSNTGIDTSVSAQPFVAVILIILAAIIAFFVQFIVIKLAVKTDIRREEPVVEPVEKPAD